MPKHATLEQRISWHLAHQENCGCRPMPQKLQMELNKRNAKAEAHE
ncbi:hypothetical protein NPE20_12090 [Mucilaginibacter sp. JC4]|uniref:Uncharacterized protein n=2 Tax=Mucilaginibacter aquariorum TaxID=2967225 RepID=A0ABT1T265_9SPHI|nr:hypothetical protein [Mucilaginibacter aquariorum]